MSLGNIQIVTWDPDTDVDGTGIYIDGERVLSGESYELDAFTVAAFIADYLGGHVTVQEVSIEGPTDPMASWYLPDSLGYDESTDEYVAPWSKRNSEGSS